MESCPVWLPFLQRWHWQMVSKCFCLKKKARKKKVENNTNNKNKTKQNKKLFLLQTDTSPMNMRIPDQVWEQCGPFKVVLDNYLQSCTPFLSYKFQFNTRISLKPQMTASWLYPICGGTHTGGGHACSHIPSSPAKTRLLPQLKWPFKKILEW